VSPVPLPSRLTGSRSCGILPIGLLSFALILILVEEPLRIELLGGGAPPALIALHVEGVQHHDAVLGHDGLPLPARQLEIAADVAQVHRNGGQQAQRLADEGVQVAQLLQLLQAHLPTVRHHRPDLRQQSPLAVALVGGQAEQGHRDAVGHRLEGLKWTVVNIENMFGHNHINYHHIL